MSDNLEHAIELMRQMPEDRQDSLARLVLHEIEEDQRWTRSTEANAGKLRGLVERVIEADERGECEPLNPDQL